MESSIAFVGPGRDRAERSSADLDSRIIRPRAVLCGAKHERYAIGDVIIRPACRPEPGKPFLSDVLDVFEGAPEAFAVGFWRFVQRAKRLYEAALNILQIS